MQETATSWLNSHFLTWQPQSKSILQSQPEWLGIFPVIAGVVRLKAFYANGTTYENTFATLESEKLYSINTSWGVVSQWLISELQSGQPVAWDVWYSVNDVRLTPIQRYQLRYLEFNENCYLWVNSIGAIDSNSFQAPQEENQKLSHKNSLFSDEVISEYDIEKLLEIKQSTGYLDLNERLWLMDFFYSRKKFLVRADGSLKSIVVISSDIVSVSSDDEFNYEFVFRFSQESQLLNIARNINPLQAPEGLADFFPIELLSGLTTALYSDNLLLAVQNPFSTLWQVLSFAELWGAALPTLVDGSTIVVSNGKFRALGTGSGNSTNVQDIINYINYNGNTDPDDTRTMLHSGFVVWKHDLTYQSTDIYYQILGTNYSAQAEEFTLADADPEFARLDLFWVDTFGKLGVTTGTPSANPSIPEALPNQLAIISIPVAAGATVPSNISNLIVYNENAQTPDEWDHYSTNGDHITVDFASTNNPLGGSKQIQVSITVPPETIVPPPHNIGEKYKGGRVFKLLDSSGHRGLIAAENDTATSVFYERLSGGGPYGVGANGVAIGTGPSNTALLLAHPRAKDQAVKFCSNLVIDGFNDWYFPSEEELYAMYFRRFDIGNFGNKTYWSSTETEWDHAKCINFGNGGTHSIKKNNYCDVRAIRSFDDTTDADPTPVLSCEVLNTTLTFVWTAPLEVENAVLSLNIKSSLIWDQKSILLIESYLGSVKTGSVSLRPSGNSFGYKNIVNTWQIVAIQLFKFLPVIEKFDCIKISMIGVWPNNLDLSFDDIRIQHTVMINPPDALTTPGTFGGADKTLKVTVSPEGKITAIEQFEITSTGGNSGVPDNGLADIAFEFHDITPGIAQEYNLDVSAIQKYMILSIALETDSGTLSGVQVKKNGLAVTALTDIIVDSTLETTVATAANSVAEGDRIKLHTSPTFTGYPRALRGKLILQKTSNGLSPSLAYVAAIAYTIQDTDYEYVVGLIEPIFIQVFGANNQLLGFERTQTDGIWSIKVIRTDAQAIKINFQKSFGGITPPLAYLSENITLLQDLDYEYVIGLAEPLFIQIFTQTGQELGFERIVLNGIWK